MKSALHNLSQVMDSSPLQYHNLNAIFPESCICGELGNSKIQVLNSLFNGYQKQIRQSIHKIYIFFTDPEGFRQRLLF